MDFDRSRIVLHFKTHGTDDMISCAQRPVKWNRGKWSTSLSTFANKSCYKQVADSLLVPHPDRLQINQLHRYSLVPQGI